MTEPTHEQKRADLARARGWTITTACLLHPSPEICWSSPDGLFKHKDEPPNPYDSAEDSRALVMWLNQQPKAVQSKFGQLVAQSVSFSWEFEGENGTCTLWDHLQDGTLYEDHFVSLLAADRKTIALAAWRAIQPTNGAD